MRHKSKNKKSPTCKKKKETMAESHIRQFINHICDGNLADANKSLNFAMGEKIKNRIRTNLRESN